MNFNLISPDNKAAEFRVNFKDPIKIKPNSKMELNWVELKRQGEVVFNEDQLIELVGIKNLPTHLPATPATPNDWSLRGSLPAGEYTYSELQEAIEDLINSLLNEDDGEKLVNRYRSALPTSGTTGTLQNDGEFGLILKEVALFEGELADTDKHDASQVTAGGDNVIYTTTNNNGVYDNYSNSLVHFDTFRGDCNGSSTSIEADNEHNSLAFIESIKTIDNQVGKIGFGIVGLEYTEGISPPPTRTNGDNPPVLKGGVPSSYIWCEFGEEGGDMVVYYAQNPAGNEVSTWNNQNFEIDNMKVIFRVPMSVAFNTRDRVKIAFEMGMSKTQTDSPQFRWKIWQLQDSMQSEPVVMYDSEPDRRNLPFKMCIGDNITYDNAIALNSQIPFGFQWSVTNADEGWRKFDYAGINKNETPNTNLLPATVIRDYTMNVGDELATVLKSTTGIFNPLYPNSCQPDSTLIRANLDFNWREQNYSIFINLPANNYKNVKETKDGGFKKSILANIPSPFTTGSIVANEGSDSGQVVSIYQPYQPIISSLENNEIATNILEIKIVDMGTEQLANELTSSIINFTIRDN